MSATCEPDNSKFLCSFTKNKNKIKTYEDILEYKNKILITRREGDKEVGKSGKSAQWIVSMDN